MIYRIMPFSMTFNDDQIFNYKPLFGKRYKIET